MVGAAGLVKDFEDLMQAKYAKTRKWLSLLAVMAILGLSGAAVAGPDDAPTPRKMPRTPVAKQQLAINSKPVFAPGKIVEGKASVIDTERLSIGDVEVRLFGVVPPQLSAFYGPQARAALDTMAAAGVVSCVVRDRDRDGRLLATCHDSNKQDMAEILLRRGLAVTARGSLRPTDLAAPYMAAEQAAQSQKTGLWSVAPPTAAEVKVVATETKDQDAKAKDGMLASLFASATNAHTEEKMEMPKAEAAKTETKPIANTENTKPVAAAVEAPPAAVVATLVPLAETPASPAEAATPTAFVERYQLLITGLLMLFTALSISGALIFNRWHDKREELRSIAAALRGELQAVRAVCIARLQTLTSDREDRATSWPRIRVLVFQAYVGRLGQLGANLARQIASIYGQASDYAAYYNAANSTDAKFEPVSKRQSLQTLVQHIEEVLPRLVEVEQTGHRNGKASMRLLRRTQVLPLPTNPRPGKSLPLQATPVDTTAETQHIEARAITHEIRSEVVPEKPAAAAADAKVSKEQMAEAVVAAATVVTAAAPETAATETAPLWGVIRRFTADRLERTKKEIAMEDLIPDYAAMTDDEIEALAYAEGLNESDVVEATAMNYKVRSGG